MSPFRLTELMKSVTLVRVARAGAVIAAIGLQSAITAPVAGAAPGDVYHVNNASPPWVVNPTCGTGQVYEVHLIMNKTTGPADPDRVYVVFAQNTDGSGAQTTVEAPLAQVSNSTDHYDVYPTSASGFRSIVDAYFIAPDGLTSYNNFVISHTACTSSPQGAVSTATPVLTNTPTRTATPLPATSTPTRTATAVPANTATPTSSPTATAIPATATPTVVYPSPRTQTFTSTCATGTSRRVSFVMNGLNTFNFAHSVAVVLSPGNVIVATDPINGYTFVGQTATFWYDPPANSTYTGVADASITLPAGVTYTTFTSTASCVSNGTPVPATAVPTPPPGAATPELDSLALFGAGGLGLLGYGRTRWLASRRRDDTRVTAGANHEPPAS